MASSNKTKNVMPIVAIIGRANTGKSTLFNRLVGKPKAVTSNIAGTTRDRVYADVFWRGKTFILADTGGIIMPYQGKQIELNDDVQAQAAIGVREADLILFVVDLKEGLTKDDQKAAEIVRKSGKPVILVANKGDNQKMRLKAEEFRKLGLGQPSAISAIQGLGIGDLLDQIVNSLKFKVSSLKLRDFDSETKIAIVGRPNVGKSSLLNAILGQKRAIVSDIPGTTRDALDTKVEINNKKYVFIDTAGIRRRGKILPGLEKYSVLRSLRTIPEADIILLIIDGQEGLTAQDMHIASYATEEAKGVILVVNKMDLIKNSTDEFLGYMRHRMQFLSFAPAVFTNALDKKNINNLLELIDKVKNEREKRVPTKKLNELISEAILRHPPAGKGKHHPKIYYTTQSGTNPPTFVFMVNDKNLFHFSYLRYLENQIRENFGFRGTAIRIVLKSKREEKLKQNDKEGNIKV